MKATGIVRRVDDFGRIVIPKEIRRQMNIKEGEALELILKDNDTICFRKYKISLCDKIDQLNNMLYDCIDNIEIRHEILKLLKEAKELVKGEE